MGRKPQVPSGDSPTNITWDKKVSIPKWAKENPNLYGLAGAAYESGQATLEGAGLALGSIAGIPVGNPIGGAGLGYSMTRQVGQLTGEALGMRPVMTEPERYRQALDDVKMGMMMEAGGQSANKLIFEPVLKGGKWVIQFVKGFVSGEPTSQAIKLAAKKWDCEHKCWANLCRQQGKGRST